MSVGSAVVWGAISIVEGAILIVIVANWLGVRSWSDVVFLIRVWSWSDIVTVVEWVCAVAGFFTVGVAIAATTANAAHELRDEGISVVLSIIILGAPVWSVSSTGVAVGVGSSEVRVPAGLRGRGRELDWLWHRSHAIIVGWTVGAFESVDVFDGEVGVVDTPGSDGPISLSAVHVSIPVPDSVVNSGFTGWDNFRAKPGRTGTRVPSEAAIVVRTFLIHTVVRPVVHVLASLGKRCSIAPGVGAVLPDVTTDVESLIGTVVGDPDLMLGAGGAVAFVGGS